LGRQGRIICSLPRSLACHLGVGVQLWLKVPQRNVAWQVTPGGHDYLCFGGKQYAQPDFPLVDSQYAPLAINGQPYVQLQRAADSGRLWVAEVTLGPGTGR